MTSQSHCLQNLNRFFSSTFSMVAPPVGFKRPRYCWKVSDPVIIFAHPLPTIPFPGHEFSSVSNSPQTWLHSILIFLPSPTANNVVHGVCESFPAWSHVSSRRSTENVARPQDSCRRSTPLSPPSWQSAHFSSKIDFLFHLLCSFVTTFVDILLPSAPHCHSGCISFSDSPSLPRRTSASRKPSLSSTVFQTLDVVFLLAFLFPRRRTQENTTSSLVQSMQFRPYLQYDPTPLPADHPTTRLGDSCYCTCTSGDLLLAQRFVVTKSF